MNFSKLSGSLGLRHKNAVADEVYSVVVSARAKELIDAEEKENEKKKAEEQSQQQEEIPTSEKARLEAYYRRKSSKAPTVPRPPRIHAFTGKNSNKLNDTHKKCITESAPPGTHVGPKEPLKKWHMPGTRSPPRRVRRLCMTAGQDKTYLEAQEKAKEEEIGNMITLAFSEKSTKKETEEEVAKKEQLKMKIRFSTQKVLLARQVHILEQAGMTEQLKAARKELTVLDDMFKSMDSGETSYDIFTTRHYVRPEPVVIRIKKAAGDGETTTQKRDVAKMMLNTSQICQLSRLDEYEDAVHYYSQKHFKEVDNLVVTANETIFQKNGNLNGLVYYRSALALMEDGREIFLLQKHDTLIAAGVVCMDLRRFDDAASYFDQAVVTCPMRPDGFLYKVFMLERRKADKSNKFEDSILLMLEHDPNNYEARVLYAVHLHKKHEMEKAIAECDIAIKIRPDLPAAYIVKGDSLRYMDVGSDDNLETLEARKMEMLMQYTKAIENDPQLAKKHMGRGYSFDRPNEELRFIQYFMKLSPHPRRASEYIEPPHVLNLGTGDDQIEVPRPPPPPRAWPPTRLVDRFPNLVNAPFSKDAANVPLEENWTMYFQSERDARKSYYDTRTELDDLASQKEADKFSKTENLLSLPPTRCMCYNKKTGKYMPFICNFCRMPIEYRREVARAGLGGKLADLRSLDEGEDDKTGERGAFFSGRNAIHQETCGAHKHLPTDNLDSIEFLDGDRMPGPRRTRTAGVEAEEQEKVVRPTDPRQPHQKHPVSEHGYPNPHYVPAPKVPTESFIGVKQEVSWNQIESTKKLMGKSSVGPKSPKEQTENLFSRYSSKREKNLFQEKIIARFDAKREWSSVSRKVALMVRLQGGGFKKDFRNKEEEAAKWIQKCWRENRQRKIENEKKKKESEIQQQMIRRDHDAVPGMGYFYSYMKAQEQEAKLLKAAKKFRTEKRLEAAHKVYKNVYEAMREYRESIGTSTPKVEVVEETSEPFEWPSSPPKTPEKQKKRRPGSARAHSKDFMGSDRSLSPSRRKFREMSPERKPRSTSPVVVNHDYGDVGTYSHKMLASQPRRGSLSNMSLELDKSPRRSEPTSKLQPKPPPKGTRKRPRTARPYDRRISPYVTSSNMLQPANSKHFKILVRDNRAVELHDQPQLASSKKRTMKQLMYRPTDWKK